MKRIVQTRVLAVLVSGAMLFSGCSLTATAADTFSSGMQEVGGATGAAVTVSEPDRFSSVAGYFVTPEPKATESAAEEMPVAESEPAQSADAGASVDVPILDIEGNFMKARSLDGIDPYNDKVVALTFDDGPFADTTPRLLDVLESNNVPATFFVVGEYVARNPEIVKRAYELGCDIGTHSWNHESNYLKWSIDDVMDQITRTNDAIEEATGLRSIIDRPPEGAINEDVATQIGRMQILWDTDPNDWKKENRDPDIVYENVVNGGEIHDGAIVLSHDIRPTTVDAYDRIIKELRDEGYKFVTVSQLIQIAQLRGKELTHIFNGAPSSAKAAENGFTAETPNGPDGNADEESSGDAD